MGRLVAAWVLSLLTAAALGAVGTLAWVCADLAGMVRP